MNAAGNTSLAPSTQVFGGEIKPANSSSSSKKTVAANGPIAYEVYVVDGDPIVVPANGQSPAQSWAVPAAVALVLLTAAGGGLFFVYKRRQRASSYRGLSEAEMGRVHRSI